MLNYIKAALSYDVLISKKLIFFSVDPADADIVVPEEFAYIIKVALSKMVAAKCLSPELVNLDFWRRIPNKFKGIRYYEDKKTKIREVIHAKLLSFQFFFNLIY